MRIKIMKKHLAICGILILAAVVTTLADWPQYLGPNRNATSQETGLSRSWPKNGPKVFWTFPLGQGWAGASVSDGKVYVLDRVGGKQDVLRCIDLANGKEEWNFAYNAPGTIGEPGSRIVPAIDGNYVYTCGCLGHVHCVDKRTHRAVWKKNIWKDFGGGNRLPTWGITQNPLIYGNMLILAAQTPKAGVVAYDKTTGAVRWTSQPLPGGPGYVSPKIVKIGGDDHLVMISAKSRQRRRRQQPERPGDNRQSPGLEETRQPEREDQSAAEAPAEKSARRPGMGAVVGIDPKTGQVLWTYYGWQCTIPIPNVTEIGDSRLFITGGYRAGSAMIKVQKKPGGFVVEEIYKTQAFG
ncbi:MAG: PQQ-binding-like beta-propeller repeat protein, partial [Planctomycetota bacterium]|nr:PQQ-binding-like beta-propeller repeat protein [Planctomycetota bacterium]